MDCADFRTNLKCVDNYLRSGGCVMMLDHCEMRGMLKCCVLMVKQYTQYIFAQKPKVPAPVLVFREHL